MKLKECGPVRKISEGVNNRVSIIEMPLPSLDHLPGLDVIVWFT